MDPNVNRKKGNMATMLIFSKQKKGKTEQGFYSCIVQ